MAYSDHPVSDYLAALGDTGQLIDVREPHEFAEGTIPGATNVPLGELQDRVNELDQERRVVVLCRSGGRSSQASELLTAAGFADVVNLEGGMLAFTDQRQLSPKGTP